MARFGRILTAMVTPFDDDGNVDLDAAASLAKWLVEQGNEGLVVAGTTGESPTLSVDEKLGLFAAVTDSVTVPVVAGSTASGGHAADAPSQVSGPSITSPRHAPQAPPPQVCVPCMHGPVPAVPAVPV